MSDRQRYNWLCRGRTLRLGGKTLVMGILNTTPDSFSDGGRHLDPGAAVAHALELVRQGADILDIGGESTRPGATPVSAEEETRRTVPVIERLRAQSDIPISIDTMKAAVAARAIEAGAEIINDVSALSADPGMADVAARTGAGVVLMHMQGTPQTMQANPAYADVVREVRDYLLQRAAFALARGIGREAIALDPGIGFGKTTRHNLALLRALPELSDCGYPLLAGVSRKRFIGELTGRTNPDERRAGSVGAAAWAAAHGAHILRVHDVIDTCDALCIVDKLLRGD